MPHTASLREMMVDTQVRPSDVTSYPIIEAMLSVPREAFLPEAKRAVAYMGEHVALEQGRAMLDPRTTAKMLEVLSVTPGDLVLDLGCGRGYVAALLGRLAQAVVALEEDETLAQAAEEALGQVEALNVAVVRGPLAEGAAKEGPYDAIFVGGGVEEFPDALCEQLAEGGRIVVPMMQGHSGHIALGRKHDGKITWRRAFDGSVPQLPGFAVRRDFAL